MGGEWQVSSYGAFSSDFLADQLGNLCVVEDGIQTGPFGSQLHQRDYVRRGTPIITVMHLGENRIVHQDLPLVSDADKRRLKKYTLKAGDIVFSRVGSVDRRAYVTTSENGWLFSGRCLRVRPDPKKLDSRFLSYFFGLPTFQQYIRSIAVGATMPSLNTRILSNVDIYYPPLPEQRAIAQMLGALDDRLYAKSGKSEGMRRVFQHLISRLVSGAWSIPEAEAWLAQAESLIEPLDDKIELNRRMNETLEAIARALFKSWFVDFDPVRAKMAGRDTGLPPHIAALFPDRLVSSELGEIPAGWGVSTLGQMCHKPQYGYTASADDNEVGPKFLRIKDINKSPWIHWKDVPYCHIDDDLLEKYLIQAGDVLIARMADPGHSVVIERHPEAVFASYLIRFQPIHENYVRYIQYWTRSNPYWELVKARGTGTTRRSLNAKVLSKFPAVLPSNAVLDLFQSQTESFRGRIVANTEESSSLAELRDALLPKLMSGELRLRDAETFLERAL